MEYKIIERPGPFRSLDGVQLIAVQKTFISFHSGFVRKFGIKKYCTFAEDASHCLCFKLSDKADKNSYCISVMSQKSGSARVISTPRSIKSRIAKFGRYEVKQDGDWFVTECKLM